MKFISFVALALSVSAQTAPPFDLTNWVLQLPTNVKNVPNDIDEFSAPELLTYNSSYFFKNSEKTAYVFRPTVEGFRSPGTNNTRVEMYEIDQWNLNNGTHRMSSRLSIDHVPTVRGRVSYSQILFENKVNLADSRSYLKCMWDRVEGMICIYELTEQFTIAPASSYTLGTPFKFEILVTKNSLSVSYNGEVKWQKLNLPALSGKVYFKAGCYSQSSVLQFGEVPTEYSQNSFFALDVKHDTATTAEIPAYTPPPAASNGTGSTNKPVTGSALGVQVVGTALMFVGALLMV